MFLNGLKAKSIIRKLKSDNSNRTTITEGNKLRSIGIIEEASEKFDRAKLSQLCKTLGVKEANVYFMTYVAKKKKEDRDNEALFSPKDIGWKGVLKTDHLKEFGSKNLDMLISYYTEDHFALSALSSLAKSKFKVGLVNDSYQSQDLTIELNTKETDLFIEELGKYLKILKIR